MTFPTDLDAFVSPTPTTRQDVLSHAAKHAGHDNAIAALQKITVGPTHYNVAGYPGADLPAKFASAHAEADAAGGGILNLGPHNGPTLTSGLTTIEKPSISVAGVGSQATVLTYSGTDELFKIAPDPLGVAQGGSFSGFTVRGTGAAGAIGVHCIDTGVAPEFDDVVIENFTHADSVGLLFENIDYFQERAGSRRLHLNNNKVGMRLVGGGDLDTNSHMYHRWLDLRLNVNDGQIGIQSKANAFVSSGMWTIVVNVAGAGTVISVEDESIWLRPFFILTGEQTSGGGGKGIHVHSTAYFSGFGLVNLVGLPHQNDNVGVASYGVVPPSLRVATPDPIYLDTGARANFVGANSATIRPFTSSPDSEQQLAAIGHLSGTNIESLFSCVYDYPGNAYVFWKIGAGDPFQDATEIGRFDVNGDVVGARGVRTGAFVTGSRPSAAGNIGLMIYDITLLKPIWSDGTAWRDAAGTTV